MHYHQGCGLKGVDDAVNGIRQIRGVEIGMNIRIAAGIFDYAVQYAQSLWVIGGLAQAQQGQLQAGDRLTGLAVSVNNAPRVFPVVKAGYLRNQRPGGIKAHRRHDLPGFRQIHRQVFGGQGINGRRGDTDRGRAGQGGRHKLRQGKGQAIVGGGQGHQGVPGGGIGRGQVNVANPMAGFRFFPRQH